MTSETSNVYFPIGEFGVDLLGHCDHVAPDFFLRIFIAGKVALNVTMCALDAQCGAEFAHCDSKINGGHFQDFQVLRGAWWTTLLLAISRWLGKQGKER